MVDKQEAPKLSSANGTGADLDGARTGSRVAIGRIGFSGLMLGVTQAFWRPIMHERGCRLRRFIEDEHWGGFPLFCTCGSQMHRQTYWDDQCRTTCPTDLKVAVRSL